MTRFTDIWERAFTKTCHLHLYFLQNMPNSWTVHFQYREFALTLTLSPLMGVTRLRPLDEVNTNDEVIPSDEEISHHWRGKESHSMMPASSLGSYETSKTDHWEPNKSPIIGLEALLREALTLQRLATKITYIKPLHWQQKVQILTL